jgi:hypothetical protein
MARIRSSVTSGANTTEKTLADPVKSRAQIS